TSPAPTSPPGAPTWSASSATSSSPRCDGWPATASTRAGASKPPSGRSAPTPSGRAAMGDPADRAWRRLARYDNPETTQPDPDTGDTAELPPPPRGRHRHRAPARWRDRIAAGVTVAALAASGGLLAAMAWPDGAPRVAPATPPATPDRKSTRL